MFSRLQQVFINSLMVFVMLLAYLLIASRFLPDGINAVFVSNLWKLVLVLMLSVFLILFLFVYFLKAKKFYYTKTLEEFSTQDVILLLLPITPVIQYIILNLDIMNITDSIIIIIFFVALGFVTSCLIPWLLSLIGSRTLLMSAGLSLTYVLVYMSALASSFKWHETGNFIIQSGIFISIAAFLFFLYSLDKKIAYLFVVVFFLSNTVRALITIHNDQTNISNANIGSSQIYSYLEGKQIKSTPDIFLLIYDSYPNEETLTHYGIDNREQIQFLKDNGFTIYSGIYSVGSYSLYSMSRVLHVKQDLHGNIRNYVSGDNAVCHILKSAGYKTIGIFNSDYFFQGGIIPSYDSYYPPFQKVYPLFIKSIIEGEFRFDAGYKNATDYVIERRNVFTQKTDLPIFLHTHSYIPGHSQTSGKCDPPDETARYKNRFTDANKEMRADLKLITEAKPGAIIIIAGDHGAYLTKNCSNLNNFDANKIDRFDIQDRFGTFLAIKWPTNSYGDRYNIRILQDIFPAIFAYLFEDDPIFDTTRMEHVTLRSGKRADVYVNDGIIVGGKDDGKPLFDSTR